MAKIVKKASVLLSAVGAARIGIEAIGSETWALVQEALEGLNDKVEGRIRAFRLNGGSVQGARPYINVVSPTASVADNSSLSATDLNIPDEVFMGISAPSTPHSYKLWLDTSTSPTVPKRWNSGTSTWLKLKGGLNNRGQWTASTVYQVDDLVTNLGSAYLVITDHTSTATPPASDTTNYSLLVAKGADGPGPGGAHAATHKGDGSDSIANATQSVSGLLSGADKTKLDDLTSDHGGLDGLADDDHAQYALSNGTRLTLATDVSSPTTYQLRSNGGVLEQWDGTAWVHMQSDLAADAPLVPKSQLDALQIDEADMSSGRSVIINTTSLTHATDVPTAVEGQVIYETDTENLLVNVSEDVNAPDWRGLVPESATYTPPFASQSGSDSLFVAYGTGDPTIPYRIQTQQLANGPTASQIGPTVIRLVRFRIPKPLTLSSVKIINSTTASPNIWRIGIYRVSDGEKLYDSGLFAFNGSTAGKELTNVAGITLDPGTSYYYALTTSSTTDTGLYFKSPPTPYLPQLGFSSGLDEPDVGQPVMVQHATTGGTLPASLTTIASPFAWPITSGSLPFLWMRGVAI